MNAPSRQPRYQPVTQPPPPRPPELRLATFTYADSRARKVCVAGDFNNWSPDATQMQRTTSGVWTIQLKLTPGRHQYRFVVDSQWLSDPKATMSAPNPHGGMNSVVIV